MDQTTLSLRPQAVADYLRHRFRIQPGEGLRRALGEPATKDNYHALNAWVIKALARFQGPDLVQRIQCIEADLLRRMYEAGLNDQLCETFPVPVGVIASICMPRRETCCKDARRHRGGFSMPKNKELFGLVGGSDAND